MPIENLQPLPSFTRSTLPNPRNDQLLRDVQVIIEEPNGDRAVWVSNGFDWIPMSAQDTIGSELQVGALTPDPDLAPNAAAVVAALADKPDATAVTAEIEEAIANIDFPAGGGSGNIDGGSPTSTYTATTPITGGAP